MKFVNHTFWWVSAVAAIFLALVYYQDVFPDQIPKNVLMYGVPAAIFFLVVYEILFVIRNWRQIRNEINNPQRQNFSIGFGITISLKQLLIIFLPIIFVLLVISFIEFMNS